MLRLSSIPSMSPFPHPDAGPAQVRAYLVDILVFYHDASVEFAQQTADLWHLGRGVDLRQAALSSTHDTFADVFGDAVGPFLHNSVREQFLLDWRTSMPGILVYWGLIGLPLLGALLLIRAWYQPNIRPRIRTLYQAGWLLGPPLWACGCLGLEYVDYAALGICGGTAGCSLLLLVFFCEMDIPNEAASGKESGKEPGKAVQK